MPTINVLDAEGATISVELPNADGRQAAAASRPVALATEDLAAITALGTKLDTLAGHVDGLEGSATALNGLVDGLETLLAATNAALATLGAQTDGLEGFTDGIETLIGSTNTALAALAGHVDGLEAAMAANTGAVAAVGTRAYGAGIARLAYGAVSAPSGVLAASEVLLHNCGSARCFIAVGATPVATVNSIPLEPGEKFHLRITSGHLVAALQDSAAGNLNIVPVA